MKRTLSTLVVAVLTFGGLVAGSGASHAGDAPAGTSRLGSTEVVVKPSVARLLAGAGITPSTTGSAAAAERAGTLALSFPIRGFSSAQLRTTHKGGFRLAAGGRGITVSKLAVDLRRATVSGRVSGTEVGRVGRVDLFTIVRAKSDRLGPAKLKLTGTAARALNGTFGVRAFSAGDAFGYATPSITREGLRNRAAQRIAAALEEFVAGH